MNIKRPQGIKSSLPTSLDGILKKRYDEGRAAGIWPSEIRALGMAGRPYQDQALLKKWRFWKTAPIYTGDGFTLTGAFDELADINGVIAPYDYKTKGSEPEAGYTERYYQLQGDCYALMIEAAKMPVFNKAYFAFYYPLGEPQGEIQFHTALIAIPVSSAQAVDVCVRAKACLDGDMPEPGTKNGKPCEYCVFRGVSVDSKVGLTNAD